jgi:hypothetical protein
LLTLALFFGVNITRGFILTNQPLHLLSDAISEAHVRIQEDFEEINPVVGLSQKMRSHGIPVDMITIDCLKSGKRIIVLLNDDQPDIVSYQFSFKAEDPDDKFETIPLGELTTQTLYDWIKSYFSSVTN